MNKEWLYLKKTKQNKQWKIRKSSENGGGQIKLKISHIGMSAEEQRHIFCEKWQSKNGNLFVGH